MDFLGIGPLELVAILLIVFIVMGPKDIVKMANTLGRTLGNLRRSEAWTAMRRAQREIRSLPDTLAKQADFEDLQGIKDEIEKDLSKARDEVREMDQELVAWTRTDARTGEAKKPAADEAKPEPKQQAEASSEDTEKDA